jgi:hypothetical protein
MLPTYWFKFNTVDIRLTNVRCSNIYCMSHLWKLDPWSCSCCTYLEKMNLIQLTFEVNFVMIVLIF